MKEGDRKPLSPHYRSLPCLTGGGRFAQSGTGPDHAALVLQVPSVGHLHQSLPLLVAREHMADKIFCCVRQSMQKPFLTARACVSEDISSPASLNLPKQI